MFAGGSDGGIERKQRIEHRSLERANHTCACSRKSKFASSPLHREEAADEEQGSIRVDLVYTCQIEDQPGPEGRPTPQRFCSKSNLVLPSSKEP
jgi:hypothetical protein